jgi:Alpha/beta hydrolase
VLVPGAGNTLDNFEGFNDSAELVQGTAAELWPDRDTATIAWLGYDTPDFLPLIPFPGFGATVGESAEGAAETLPPFLEGIDRDDLHVTVIGHSYGSVAVGLSARERIAADDIVFIGSPGVRAATAAELGAYNVWAGLNPGDPIRWVDNISVLGIGHGPQPAHPPFGARRFRTDGASGHAYYVRDSESLYNMVRIVVGEYQETTVCRGNGDRCD